MNKMKSLVSVTGLLIATVAWPGVVVHESATVVNSIGEGNFGSGRIGGPLPKPWQCSKGTEQVRITLETPAGRPEGERWARLIDGSEKENANIRQTFAPVTNGQFRARVISNLDGGRLSFNFGTGGAAKPEDRALQLSIDADGALVVRGEPKRKTSLHIKVGEVYWVRCDFEPVKQGRALRVVAELTEESSQRQNRVETEVETQVAINSLRITSTGPDTGVDYYVTDLSLVGR